MRDAWANIGDGQLDVYRIYAEFETNDAVGGVWSASPVGQSSFMTNTVSGVLWNYTETTDGPTPTTLHFDTAPDSSRFDSIDTAASAFDTFATVGFAQDDEFTVFESDAAIGLDHFQSSWTTASFSHTGSVWYTTAGGPEPPRVAAGDSQPGLPDDGVSRVLLFQVAVPEGEDVEGQFGLQLQSEGNVFDSRTHFSTAAIPLPGCAILMSAVFFRRRARK